MELGENCIVAAGSVVTHSFPSNSVIGGNPARLICTLDEMYQKRSNRQVSDAFRLASIIRKEYKREPTIEDMSRFYPLFLERTENVLADNGICARRSGDVEEEIVNDFYSTKPVFNGFDDFLQKSKALELQHVNNDIKLSIK